MVSSPTSWSRPVWRNGRTSRGRRGTCHTTGNRVEKGFTEPLLEPTSCCQRNKPMDGKLVCCGQPRAAAGWALHSHLFLHRTQITQSHIQVQKGRQTPWFLERGPPHASAKNLGQKTFNYSKSENSL